LNQEAKMEWEKLKSNVHTLKDKKEVNALNNLIKGFDPTKEALPNYLTQIKDSEGYSANSPDTKEIVDKILAIDQSLKNYFRPS
jgi:hypothetical protein